MNGYGGVREEGRCERDGGKLEEEDRGRRQVSIRLLTPSGEQSGLGVLCPIGIHAVSRIRRCKYDSQLKTSLSLTH